MEGMKNRNVRLFTIIALGLVVLIFAITILFSRVWPDNQVWYMQNMSWLIPLVIAVFFTPIVTLILNNWDINFHSQEISDGNLVVIVSNHGTTPFAFNRVQFASHKKFWLFGKRELYPQNGMSDEDIEYHGADTPSRMLHQHIGCTLRKGLPITLTIRRGRAPKNLCNFKKNEKVYLSLYYERTNQRVCSKPITREIITALTRNYKQA